jgi:hypothetical protein
VCATYTPSALYDAFKVERDHSATFRSSKHGYMPSYAARLQHNMSGVSAFAGA